jgi:hypothetical protein
MFAECQRGSETIAVPLLLLIEDRTNEESGRSRKEVETRKTDEGQEGQDCQDE